MSSPTPQRGRMVAAVGPRVLVVVCALGVLQCSVDRRYRTLSFIFDGVPDPNAPVAGATDAAQTGGAITTDGVPIAAARPTEHGPWAAAACKACHTFTGRSRNASFSSIDLTTLQPGAGEGFLRKPLSELCVSCHTRFSAETATRENTWLHGPVGAGACTFCHSPHTSRHTALLRAAPPRALCVRCHDTAALASNEEHPPVEEECTDCHNPHRGESRWLL